MAVGDWSDTTDFWTDPPPLLISAIKANTMFLNTFRLYKGAERFSEAMRYTDTYTYAATGGSFYYSFRITDDCPWDRLQIIEKIQTDQIGTANLRLQVDHVGVGTIRGPDTLDCADYNAAFTWVTVLDDYDITGWAAGNHIIRVYWWPLGIASCNTVEVKCRHAMLKASLV
jgi:hypothetical protein